MLLDPRDNLILRGERASISKDGLLSWCCPSFETLLVGQRHHRRVVALGTIGTVDEGVRRVAELVDVVGGRVAGWPDRRRAQRPRYELLDDAAERLVESLDNPRNLVRPGSH